MLSENIKAIRTAKNLSQEELAQKLNVVRQTISKWEKGLSVPDAGTLVRIADALDTTVQVLLEEDVPAPEEAENVKELSAKLEKINEQLAAQSEKRRKIWRVGYIAVGLLSLPNIFGTVFRCIHFCQINNTLDDSVSIIGGADGPTAILVSAAPVRGLHLILSIVLLIAAVIGFYATKRK